jgi:hypothetical protein
MRLESGLDQILLALSSSLLPATSQSSRFIRTRSQIPPASSQTSPRRQRLINYRRGESKRSSEYDLQRKLLLSCGSRANQS